MTLVSCKIVQVDLPQNRYSLIIWGAKPLWVYIQEGCSPRTPPPPPSSVALAMHTLGELFLQFNSVCFGKIFSQQKISCYKVHILLLSYY